MASNESSTPGFAKHPLAENPVVRIRECHPDPFHGLKGHDYIAARNLNKHVQRVQTYPHSHDDEATK